MCAVAIDLFNKFKNVGFTEAQASLLATLFSKAHLSEDLVVRKDLNKYATQSEFYAYKSDMKHYQKILEMRSDHKFDQVFRKLDQCRLELKNEMAQILLSFRLK